MVVEDYIPSDIVSLYEVRDYKHAAAILANEFTDEFKEICEALRQFQFTEEDVKTPGEAKAKSQRGSPRY